MTFVPGFWNWTLTHNTGAAFSFLADAGGWQHWFFVVLASLISARAGGRRCAQTARGDWRTALPFALVIAGALGNVIDRLRFGYVVDFVAVVLARLPLAGVQRRRQLHRGRRGADGAVQPAPTAKDKVA